MSRSGRVLAIGGKHCDYGWTGSIFIRFLFSIESFLETKAANRLLLYLMIRTRNVLNAFDPCP